MNYKCPYCGHHVTITSPNRDSHWNYLRVTDCALGKVGFKIDAITCPNPDCKQLNLLGMLKRADAYGNEMSDVCQYWNLLPESSAKVLPSYIPEAIRNDYIEACRISSLSPKASATLSRRCLQGMIRDFHGIKMPTLSEEVKALKSQIPNDVWESIDAVRSVGNIGAHMEKDIDVIVDVEPNEALLLIGLIEQLIEDWYVVREERRNRVEGLKQLAAEKQRQRKAK